MALPLAAVALGIGAISGIGNMIANMSANERAEKIQSENFQRWMQLNIPDPKDQEIVLQKFVNEGTLDPVMQQAIQADPSQFEKIVTTPSYQAAQNRALSELENIGYEGGLRLQDEAALQDAMLGAQTRAKSNRMGIMDEMGRRGAGGGGMELAARLEGQQQAGDQEAQSALKIAAGAQDRALQSIMGAGDLAGKYRAQEFGEKGQKASAADRINMFNTQNLQSVNAANVGAQNRAQEMNLVNKQNISNQNVGAANAQEQYNKGLIQQQFDNQVKQLSGASGQAAGLAQTAQRGGQIAGNTMSNIGGAAANYATLEDYWDRYDKRKGN